MLRYSDLYTVEPLLDELWVLAFCTVVVISSRITGLKLIVAFNEVGHLVLANGLDVGRPSPYKEDIGHILNMSRSGSCSTSVHTENPM